MQGTSLYGREQRRTSAQTERHTSAPFLASLFGVPVSLSGLSRCSVYLLHSAPPAIFYYSVLGFLLDLVINQQTR